MWARSLVMTIALCLLANVNGLGAEYKIIDLGVLPGGTSTRAYGINELGQVVGEAWLDSGDSHAFLWDPEGGMQDLGGVGGSRAVAVNNRGQVVGTSHLHVSDGWRAFVWSTGTGMVELGTLNGGQSWACDITGDGHVFGFSISWDRELRIFEWSADAGMTDVGLPGTVVGPDRTICVNEIHQVAGTFWDAQSAAYHAFLWDAAGGIRDIGPFAAYDLSNDGYVVGGYAGQASIWDLTRGVRLLGTLQGEDPTVVGDSSLANGVNDLGQVVGSSHFYDGKQWINRAAFVWEEATGMAELPSLGGTYSDASAINNAGLIAGFSTGADGITHAVLWTPVPEPASLLALLSGLAGVGGIARRRR